MMKPRWKGPHSNQRGLTLIEIVIVIALIAAVGAFLIPKIGSSLRITVTSASREFATTIKSTFNAAAVSGKVHRIVYDLNEQEFWTEQGSGEFLLHTDESLKKEQDLLRYGKDKDEMKNKIEKEFSIQKLVTPKKKKLPRGVKILDVVNLQSKDPISEGLAYTHFFPQGFTEPTLIHLEDDQKHVTTVVIYGSIGKTQIANKLITREEAFGKR